MWGMKRYRVALNYIYLRDDDKNKGVSMYIERRTKYSRNIVGFINSAWPETTNKQPNFIFEGCEGNNVFVCAIKSIATGEYLFISYKVNQIDI